MGALPGCFYRTRKNLKVLGRNLNFLKFFYTQHFRNCCSAALKLLPDTHHGCVLIPGIYNRSLVFSDQFLLPPFLIRKLTDKTLDGAFFLYKNCNDFFPGQQHHFHSYQLKMTLWKIIFLVHNFNHANFCLFLFACLLP